MKKFGYDANKSIYLGHAIEAKPYNHNDIKKMMRKQGDEVMMTNIGFSYVRMM